MILLNLITYQVIYNFKQNHDTLVIRTATTFSFISFNYNARTSFLIFLPQSRTSFE